MSLSAAAIQILKDNASLILAPSAPYNVGGFQAIRPFTEAGRFDFSRTTGKYVEKSSGLEWVEANVPAFDLNGALVCEPARTNLIFGSNDISNATYWGVFGSTVTAQISDNPFDTSTFFLKENTANSTHVVLQIRAGKTLGQNYCLSVYVKANGRTKIQIFDNNEANVFIIADLSTGTITSVGASVLNSGIEDAGNGYYRIFTAYRAVASTSVNCQLRLLNDLGNTTYLGDGVSGVLLNQGQFELGTYPSSPIITTGATATRTQDKPDLKKQTLTGDFWVFTDIVIPSQTVGIFDVYTASGTRAFYYAIDSSGKATLNLSLGGPSQTPFGPVNVAGDTVRILIRKNSAAGTFSLFSNGTKHGTDITTTTTDINRFVWLGSYGYNMSVNMENFALGDNILTDAQAITLTS